MENKLKVHECERFRAVAAIYVSKQPINKKILLINRMVPGLANTLGMEVANVLKKEKNVTVKDIDIQMQLALSEFMKTYTQEHSKKCSKYFMKKNKEQLKKDTKKKQSI